MRPRRTTDDTGVRLGSALRIVHRDPHWWLKCLMYGAIAATGVGLPLAAGFVMESLDNSRRGYPTPLPPWGDPSLRSLVGFFALLIDFAFFGLPLLIGGVMLFCVALAFALAWPAGRTGLRLALPLIMVLIGCVVLLMFVAGVAPLGRLRFSQTGRIEEALDLAMIRWALAAPQRGIFLRARLMSLPAYLPALLLAGGLWRLLSQPFPGQILVAILGLWLTLAALIYAHLIVVQLYVAAERELQQIQRHQSGRNHGII